MMLVADGKAFPGQETWWNNSTKRTGTQGRRKRHRYKGIKFGLRAGKGDLK